MMNVRLLRGTIAIASVLVASIAIGGMAVFVGGLLYGALVEAGFPNLAIVCLIIGSLLFGGCAILVGQIALQRAMLWPPATKSAGAPEDFIATELASLVEGHPIKLVAASLGLGFVLGLSPRLRRAVYRSLVE
jgi:hypothetical protein